MILYIYTHKSPDDNKLNIFGLAIKEALDLELQQQQIQLSSYRLRNCQLIQYKKGIDDFKLCDDKTTKRQYNIHNILSIINWSKNTIYITLDIDTQYQSDSILCSSTKILQCQHQIPSNICFALYYLLQKLYKHKEILNTPDACNVCVFFYMLFVFIIATSGYSHSKYNLVLI